MSPKGRVKVALAGLTTSVLAVFLTLRDTTATGRLTTKKAAPIAVATRHAGRTTTVSAITTNGSRSSEAKLGVTPPKLSASTHTVVNSLVFMGSPSGTPGHLSNKFLSHP